MKAQRVIIISTGIPVYISKHWYKYILSLTSALDGVGCQRHSPAAFPPVRRGGKIPALQEAGWAPEPVCLVWKSRPPKGFDLRFVQPVASNYTD